MGRARLHGDDAGFTLLEILVALTIMGILTGLAVGPFRAYERATKEQGSVRDVVSTLRNAQERAVSEARTYCVTFNTSAGTYTLSRPVDPSATPLQCDATTVGVRKAFDLRSRIAFESVSFTSASGSNTVFFTPRGSATPGNVVISRPGSSKRYTVSVEGLTARVSSTS
ncbi:MAG: GspH/FimT family pseudopilin [Frankiaceae bacterium]|nr:GspH/FimT family pseudopilin [Frankiaceae bacterium]